MKPNVWKHSYTIMLNTCAFHKLYIIEKSMKQCTLSVYATSPAIWHCNNVIIGNNNLMSRIKQCCNSFSIVVEPCYKRSNIGASSLVTISVQWELFQCFLKLYWVQIFLRRLTMCTLHGHTKNVHVVCWQHVVGSLHILLYYTDITLSSYSSL